MQHFTVLTAAVLFAFSSFSQTIQDSVVLGAGYTDAAYYKLDGGTNNTVNNTDWDLAFDVSGQGISIRLNGNLETNLWVYPNGDTADWVSVDTTGMSGWTQLYDSEEAWLYGAFEMSANPSNWQDVGWGMYNPSNHQIIGHRLFIIKLGNGSYQKLWIKSMIGGVYTFRHASLDGSTDMTHTLTKSNYTGKLFAYFSLQNHQAIDREPMMLEWDFVVTRYIADYNGAMSRVTGILLNNGIYAAEARDIAVEDANHWDYESDSLINTIGWDWKEINYQTFQWELEDSLSYFIQGTEGNIWHVEFTGFAGTSTGKIWFNNTLVSATGIDDVETEMNVAVYPNPSTDGNVSLVFNLEENEAIANVYDITGKLVGNQVFQSQGFKQRNLQLNNFSAGTYILRLETESTVTTKKIIINK